ncbi:MAG: hypothetical protein ABIH23_09195, partial [bacterium]
VSASDEETVFVHDIWIKECRDYPNGKHVIVAGDKTLVDEDNSEPDMLPYFTFRVKPIADEIYGDGILKNILRLQRDMNRVESIVQENASLMGLSVWLVNRGAGVLKSAINNVGGGVIEWDGNIKPERDQGVPVPEQIANRWWDIFRKMQVITGLQDPGMGMIPYRGSQTSSGVIKELKLSEDVNFAPDISELTDYVKRIMRRYFYLARKYYAEPRMISIMGENRRPEIVWFTSSDIVKDPDFDIDVGSGFSQSQEARMDQMIQFAQTGIFNMIPGIDWRTVGEEILDYAGLKRIKENTYADELQARRNLQTILMGNDVPLSQYANLAAHIKVFTDYIKRPEYEFISIEQKTAVDRYIGRAKQMQQMQMMQQMQQMQMMQGGPPTGPGNQAPQGPTGTERGMAAAAQQQSPGRPPADMEQAGEPALQGV